MKTSPNLRRLRSAFTLLEIMLVLIIIAVLLSAGIYLTVGNVDVARERRVEADLSTITTQLKTYEALNLTLPTSEQGVTALVSKPVTDPVPRQWKQLLKSLPTDPWGTAYGYRYPGKHNSKDFDLWSFGPDRVESEDDIGNWNK